jgi:hypothetical protein
MYKKIKGYKRAVYIDLNQEVRRAVGGPRCTVGRSASWVVLVGGPAVGPTDGACEDAGM